MLKLILSILLGSKKDYDLALENFALRQQLATMRRSAKRPQLRNRDRLFWILLSRFWNNWREALIIVNPDTVVRWHKKGFKLFWRFKSRSKGPGRPPVSPEICDLILNPTSWSVGAKWPKSTHFWRWHIIISGTYGSDVGCSDKILIIGLTGTDSRAIRSTCLFEKSRIKTRKTEDGTSHTN
jgi:hypothetical protein